MFSTCTIPDLLIFTKSHFLLKYAFQGILGHFENPLLMKLDEIKDLRGFHYYYILTLVFVKKIITGSNYSDKMIINDAGNKDEYLYGIR